MAGPGSGRGGDADAALVQVVQVTEDRAAAVREISAEIPGTSPADVSVTPCLLLGSHEQMAGQLLAQAAEFGITSYVVREPAVADLERVLALLRN